MIDEIIIKQWMLENNGNILYDTLHPGIFAGYVTFTPERSASALENNTRNRKLKDKTQIPILINAMRSGEWDENIEPISFTKNGVMSNGQHRCEGSVRGNVTFRNLVIYGVSDRSQHYTDRGQTRKLSEDLQIDGFKNTNHLAAIIRVVYRRNVKKLPIKSILNRTIEMSAISDSVLYDFFYDHKDEIVKKERFTAGIYNSVIHLGIPGEIVNILSLEFDRISKNDAECFWERLSSGFTTVENDPIMILRDRLSKNKDNKQNKLSDIILAAFFIKTWNAYMKGETIKSLKFSAGGSNPESFPEIYNPYLEGDG